MKVLKPANRLLRINVVFILSFWMAGCATQEITAADNQAGGTDTERVREVSIADIDKIFENYDEKDVPGCAVAVYRNGETVFSAGYGIANLDYGIPISETTSFYMASVSKQVTAAAAGLLIVRGELDPKAEVEEYIQDWPEWASGVQVGHLFSHTSGLPDVYDLMSIANISISNVMDLEDYMAVVKRGERLMFEPGSEYSYSNSGYTTLAYLIEKISGTKFSEFVDTELLRPLGMRSTHFHDDRHRVIPNRAISYEPVRNGFRKTYINTFQGVGPGGLYSTLNDWQRWESFWNGTIELNGSITADEAGKLKRLMVNRATAGDNSIDYGMGLQIATRKGAEVNGHSGSFMGFKTDYRRYPQYGLAMVTLCNRGDADPQEKNGKLADLFLKDQFETFLAPYKGIYHSEELPVDFRLTVEDGNLKLNRRLSPNGFMTENGDDKWGAGSWEIVFQRNSSGDISGFVVSTGRAREVEFRRVE